MASFSFKKLKEAKGGHGITQLNIFKNKYYLYDYLLLNVYVTYVMFDYLRKRKVSHQTS